MANVEVARSRLSQLVSDVRNGELQIPEFQRDFVWNNPDKVALVDSILHNHPIGSLLTLEVDPTNLFFAWSSLHDTSPPVDKLYDSIPLPAGKSAPKYLLLDGQQRMTTLSHLFGGMGTKSWFISTKEIQNKWEEDLMPSRQDDKNKWTEWLESFDYSSYIKGLKKHADPPSYFGQKQQRLSLELLVDRQACGDVIQSKTAKLSQLAFNLKHIVDNYSSGSYPKPKSVYALELEQSDKDIKFLSVLSDMITNVFEFYVPQVQVPKEMSVAGVCKIFTTINQTGQKLGAFDLTVASLYPKSVFLKKLFDDAMSKHSLCQIVDKSDKTWILQTLALVNGLDPTSSKLPRTITYQLFNDKRFQLVSEAFEEILKFLDRELGASIKNRKTSNISFKRILPVFSACQFFNSVSSGTPDQKTMKTNKLVTFYLAASISNRYSTSSGTLQLGDVTELRTWLEAADFNTNMPVWLAAFVPQPYTDLHENARTAAISKMLLGLLDHEDPIDIHNAKSVRFEKKDENKVEIHHIFPKAYLESLLDPSLNDKQKENIMKNERKKDSVINSMLLTNDTNNIVISDKPPSEYIQSCYDRDGVQTIDRRLERSLIDEKSVEYLLIDDYDGFIDSRCKYVADRINQMARINLFSLEIISLEDQEEKENEDTDEDEDSLGIL